MNDATVGLIGVGLVGHAVAQRLRMGGLEVIGFDVDTARLDELVASGGQRAPDAMAVVQRCQTVLLALLDTDITAQVLAQVRPALGSKHRLIDLSTGDPQQFESLARELRTAGVTLVDAPMSGSSRQIAQGHAVVMLGCEPEEVPALVPLLDLLCEEWIRMGPAGAGQRAKLATNLLLGLNRAALAEALAFAQSIGIEGRAFIELARLTPAWSAAIDAKAEKMLTRSYGAESRIVQHHKDLALIERAARASGCPVPLTRTHSRLLEAAIRGGLGDADNAAIIEIFRQPHLLERE